MGSRHEGSTKHERPQKRSGLPHPVQLVTMGLAVAAIAKELRTPSAERTWNGKVAGFVPYDFRLPTLARIRERLWAPENPKLVGPRVFGVGWTLNVGRLVQLVRQKLATTG